jgi:mannobiose 2-epimerase
MGALPMVFAGSWLIFQAAEVLSDKKLLEEARRAAMKMAQAVHEEAVDADGGLVYEGTSEEIIDTDKHWWP